MHQLVEALLVSVLCVNFFVLGTSRLRAVIRASAVQGVLLGVTLACVHHGAIAITLAAGAILIKGFVIPSMLHRAMREAVIRREVEPLLGFTTSLVLGAVATGASLVYARTLPLAPEQAGSLLVPTSFATALTGFLVLATRRKAITQAVGYLLLENGVFLMGLTLVAAMPFLVEAGVMLDLVVGIFVLGIIIHHIQREFASLDTTRLSTLKD